MRQISIVLASAIVMATVPMASMLSMGSNPTPTAGVVRPSTPIGVMKMMKDAKDLPEESYLAF